MDTIGLDLHKRESQLAIKAADGTITERRIVTSRERFSTVLGGQSPARVLLEAGTESEWVARHLESGPNLNDHKWNPTIDAGRRQLQARVRRRFRLELSSVHNPFGKCTRRGRRRRPRRDQHFSRSQRLGFPSATNRRPLPAPRAGSCHK